MSQPIVEPYLFFPGTCAEAIEFYQSALGANLGYLLRMKDAPEQPPGGFPPEQADKIMHASFRIGETTIMASDGCGEAEPFGGISLSLAVQTEAEAERYFNALAEGGKITMPLAKTFWSPRFGCVTDKFGVSWMINTRS